MRETVISYAFLAPVLLFAFTGIVVGLASVFTNTQVVGKIAEEKKDYEEAESIYLKIVKN